MKPFGHGLTAARQVHAIADSLGKVTNKTGRRSAVGGVARSGDHTTTGVRNIWITSRGEAHRQL